ALGRRPRQDQQRSAGAAAEQDAAAGLPAGGVHQRQAGVKIVLRDLGIHQQLEVATFPAEHPAAFITHGGQPLRRMVGFSTTRSKWYGADTEPPNSRLSPNPKWQVPRAFSPTLRLESRGAFGLVPT